jgi:hypothetical protein
VRIVVACTDSAKTKVPNRTRAAGERPAAPFAAN